VNQPSAPQSTNPVPKKNSASQVPPYPSPPLDLLTYSDAVHKIIARGGRVLMPIFALGEAQNILFILEEYWSQNPDLQTVPIYYTSSLARKCMAVYQTYTNMMNERIRQAHRPFEYKYVKFLKQVENFEDIGACVMLATPGMLQSGGSRVLLEKWASDAKNGVILAGYSVEGTMARVPRTPELVLYGGRFVDLGLAFVVGTE